MNSDFNVSRRLTPQPLAANPAPASPQTAASLTVATPQESTAPHSTAHRESSNQVNAERNTSNLDPNVVSFGSPQIAEPEPSLNPGNYFQKTLENSQAELTAFEQETQQLEQEKQKLSTALDNWKDNPVPGMSRGEARRALKKINVALEGRHTEHNDLKHRVLRDQTLTQGEAFANWTTGDDAASLPNPNDVRSQASQRGQRVMNAIDYYATHQNANEFTEDAPRFELEQGMDLVYVEMMANISDTQKTDDFIQLVNQLQEDPNARLSDTQNQLLEAYGLIQDAEGQLKNVMSGAQVQSEDLADFKDIIQYQKSMLLNEENNALDFNYADPTVNAIASRFNNEFKVASGQKLLATALLSEQHLKNSGEALEQAIAAAKAERANLLSQKETLSKKVPGLEQSIKTLTQEQEALVDTSKAISDLKTPEEVTAFINNASPQQQKALEKMGIQQDNTGQLRINGKTIEPGAAMRALSKAVQSAAAETGQELQKLEQEADAIEQELAQLDEDINQAGKTVKDLDQAVKTHQKNLENDKATVQQIKDLMNNPAEWNALPPEEQQQLREYVARSEARHQQAETLINTGRSESKALREAISDTAMVSRSHKKALGRALAQLAGSGTLQQLFSKMNHDIQEKSKTEKPVSREDMEREREVMEKLEEANALAEEIELAPEPDTEDVLTLIRQWEVIIRDTQVEIDAITAEMGSHQLMERNRLAEYAEKSQSLLEYTQEYIKNLSSAKREDLQQLTGEMKQLASGLASVI